MEKFESLLDYLQKHSTAFHDDHLRNIQAKVVECRTEFNHENYAKNKARAKYEALLEISKLMFESFANRVNNGL